VTNKEADDAVSTSEGPVILEAIKTLIKSRDICVLSTVSGGTPHCSLMSYVTDDTCSEFYMITLTGTKKYQNLEGNSTVSLLIDNREDHVGSRSRDIQALTVSAVFHTLANTSEEERILRQLLQRHPHLRKFAESSLAKVFAIRVKTFQLLDGVSRSHCVEVE
jgi:nitroimidazol reductase NimA-like FMN-containing flavoprotein (pyridoxamine 5'-phosphate oxidase superfamily)